MGKTNFSNAVAGQSTGDGIVIGDGFSGPDQPGVAPGAGSPAAFPQSIAYNVVDGIVAHAGGGQANATPLTGDSNRVTTTATAGDSVILPAATKGKIVTVRNDGAASLNVFPPVGGFINNGAVNVAQAVAVGAQAELTVYTAGTYRGPVGLA